MEIIQIILLILAALSLGAALYFVVIGFQRRSAITGHAYGVGRQEARQSMILSFGKSIFFIILAVLLGAGFGLASAIDIDLFEPEPTAVSPTLTVSATLAPLATVTDTRSPSPEPTATEELVTATPTPTIEVTSPLPGPTSAEPTATATPTATPTSDIPTAIVNSPNGLWLRNQPGGTQELELIPDGAILTVLDGRQTVDDIEWQQVRTPSGNEGWVAVDFIIYR